MGMLAFGDKKRLQASFRELYYVKGNDRHMPQQICVYYGVSRLWGIDKCWVGGLGEGLFVLSFLWTCVFADQRSFWGPRTTVPFAFTYKAFFNLVTKRSKDFDNQFTKL